MLKPTTKTSEQLFRYLFVGGAAFAVDFGVLYALTEYLGLHYLVSAVISFLLGLALNYALCKIWVFGAGRYKNAVVEFTLFAAIGLVGLGINEGLLWLLTAQLGFWYMVSKVMTAVVVLAWNFTARKISLFK